MNRQEIIDIAIEAGFRAPTPSDGCMGLAFDFRDGTDTGASLEKFAALVAAKEREACRSACESIADEYQKREGRKFPELKSDAHTGASDCESAIRARGQS